MKVLLINPFSYPKRSAGSFEKFLTPMPPIGMAYLLAAVEKAGLTALFHDDFVEQGNDEKLEELLRRERPELIGIPIYTSPVVYRFEEISALIRRVLPGAKIVSGNLHANIYAKTLIEEGKLDLVVKGEGEETLVALAQALQNGDDLKEVHGLFYKSQSGEVIETPNRANMPDISQFPYPAWHLMPWQKYNINEIGKVASTGIFILASRGCPFSCDFCCVMIQGTKRRRRSPEDLCDELEWLHKTYKFKSFHFIDAMWPINPAEAIAFCDEYKKRGLHKKMKWGTETRIDALDEASIKAMGEAGCRKVMFGIESGDEEILKSINKKTKISKARQIIEWSHKYKLSPTGFFIIGLPGETEEHIRKTIKHSLSLKLHFAKFACFVPYPGTKLFTDLKAQNLFTDTVDWNRFTSYPSLENPPIYLPETLTTKRLVYLQKLAHLKFYMRPRHILYVLGAFRFSIGSFRNGFGLFIKLLDW